MEKKTFNQKFVAVLTKLGLVAAFKEKTLTEENQESIRTTYKELYGSDMDDDSKAAKVAAEKSAAFDAIASMITIDEPAAAAAGTGASEDTNAVVAAVREIRDNLKSMASKAQPEGVQTVAKEVNLAGMPNSATHYCGIEHPVYSFDKRYNRIARDRAIPQEEASAEEKAEFRADFAKYAAKLSARYKELFKAGLIVEKQLATIDYSGLVNAGLGAQYLVRRQDALISRIIALPSLDAIFPRRSNIQDGELLTNAFFGEFSQSYQAGELSKGSAELQPELAKVDDVMFKYLIASFKWLEKSYLGYLNTSGSDPIKWNMIEWFVLQVAKKLQNERNVRAIHGYRLEPVSGQNAHANFAATGLIHRLMKYVEDLKIQPFTTASLQSFTSSTIGTVFKAFVAEVADHVDNLSEYALYVSDKYKPWFRAWYTATYGTNANFDGVNFMVPDYEVPIIFVPNMGSTMLMFMTIPGNIQQLENVPGEMTKMSFEQRLESVWAYSVWKEGMAATFAGKKHANASALAAANYEDQIIFMNYPQAALDADATTADADDGWNFLTGTNTAATALTDISHAKQGVVYRIEIGDDTYPTSIAKSSKFAGLTSKWEPAAEGDWIKVYYDGTQFNEIARSE